MLPSVKPGFELDRKLDADSIPLMWLGLCELRLMDEKRWPWVILVPQRPGIYEIHDLTPLDQAMLTFETNTVAAALKSVTRCTKINTGALGNVVRQLHVHIVARDEGDANWPGPVWGYGLREPWPAEGRHRLVDAIKSALSV